MQFSHIRNNDFRRKTGTHGQQLYSEDPDNQYEHNINFYTIPPFGKISLEEAEDMVSERLNLLKVCDELLRTSENNPNFKRNKNYFDLLDNKLQNADSKNAKNFYLALRNGTKAEVQIARKTDLISHFLLRIYYCQNEELKKWLISRECELLRIRLMKESDSFELAKVLQKNGFVFDEATNEEKKEFYCQIFWNQTNTTSSSNSSSGTVYKIPFEQSIDAVRNRKVYLNSGFAYIPIQDMISVICTKFRANLSYSLTMIQKSLHHLEEDERLIPRLHSMHLHRIRTRKSADKSDEDTEAVTPEMIDTLSKESFSPCMRSIHETLRKEHHLKYYGRLHYGLFLKAIGLSLDDALNFFRDEFTQKIAPEKFGKEYAYNIRYNYGKEGRKVVGKAFGCQKVINDNPPGPGDTHGCPFKHFDQNHLIQMLRRYEVNEETVNQILEFVEQKDYSKACSKYFNSKHLWYPEINIHHPNQFYSESRKALKMQNLTPPPSGQQVSDETPNDISLFADTTTDTLAEESMFETEDDFDKSIASMDLEISANCQTNESTD